MGQDIPKVIKQILELARWAPSSHNTQPWVVEVRNERQVLIGFDPSRQLKVGDPNVRELFISIGCFIETFIRAAEVFGKVTDVQILAPDPAGVALLTLKDGNKNPAWEKPIKLRRSNRQLYEKKQIPGEVLDELASLKHGSASVQIVKSPADIKFMAAMTKEATLKLMTPQAFRDELAEWVRHNWTRRPDGMPGYSQGIPGPVSLLAKFVIRKNQKMAKGQAKKDSSRILRSSAILLICVSRKTYRDWINAGRVFQAVCLQAEQKGLKTSPISAAIVDAATTTQVIDRLGLHSEPVALIRAGYVRKLPKALPRRSVRELVTKAG